ncbi:DUF3786 domain-containing protein [Candidatus Omnitrophota bacterium]
MGYTAALSKSWDALGDVSKEGPVSLRVLADEYSVDLDKQRIFSLSCNSPAKDYLTILILHYLKQRSGGLPAATGEWVGFNQLSAGQGYYPAFKKRVIGPIMRKYGGNPQAILEAVERFGAKRVQLGDYGITLDVFEGVPVLITFWQGDDEFGPEANVLFDKSIENIFCTEDIVILAEFVAHNI